ncbi:MAG: glutathione S-transferase family protein [Myxococcota bacterium]|nr:glutathione S-transferase family protein [Myxococcota bacterium]
MTRLRYFELRGRAEAIRLYLHGQGVPFDDDRVVDAAEWAALQPTLPFGRLPIFEDGDVTLAESHAILRHLGRRGIGASDSAAALALDVTHEFLAESQEDLWRFNWEDAYYDRLEVYAERTLEVRLGKLEAFVTRGDDPFVAAPFSHVHCLAFVYLDEVDAFFPAVLARHEALSALRERVAGLPGIAEYLASSARPLVFGIGRMGPKLDPRVPLPSDAQLPSPWTSDPIDLAAVARRQRRLT